MNVPSENILKLIELTDRMCTEDNEKNNFLVLKELKKIIEGGKSDIDKTRLVKNKIKCYETMCSNITKVLSSIKIV